MTHGISPCLTSLLFGSLGFTCGIAAYSAVRAVIQLARGNPLRMMWWSVMLLSVVGVSVAVGYLHDLRTDQLFDRGHDGVTYFWTLGNSIVASTGYWLALKYGPRQRRR